MLPYTHVILSLLMRIHVYIIMHATYHYMYMYVWIFGFIIFVVLQYPAGTNKWGLLHHLQAL